MRMTANAKTEAPGAKTQQPRHGTEGVNPGCLQCLVRPSRHFQAGLTNAATALAHRMIPAPKHPTGLVGPALDIKGYKIARSVSAAPVA